VIPGGVVVRFVTLGATTMRRLIPFLLALLVVLEPAGVPSAQSQEAASPASPPGWASLGPVGPFPVTVVAVSLRWPADLTMLVATDTDLARSRNGGTTWERLALPTGSDGQQARSLGRPDLRVQRLVAAIDLTGNEIWFLEGRGYPVGPLYLFKSLDRGETWSEVIKAGFLTAAPGLVLSPTFSVDGTAFFVGDEHLSRSVDSGSSWIAVDPLADERVQQVVLSPAFDSDRMVFARVVPPNAVGSDRGGTIISATAHDQSAGIVVSSDGGGTWARASTGLEIGGVPFRHVQDLAISPGFAADRSLLAVAWGPPSRADARLQ
jgi:hypothetical protein